MIAHVPSIGVEQAHRTLLNAARFLGSSLGRPGCAPVEGRHQAKVIGNGLRELDRFLSVLLDELGIAAGWAMADIGSLARIRNTPNKLETICLRMNIEGQHDVRLRALGRCRDALFHCDGVVRRGDCRHTQTLTRGWPSETLGGVSPMLRIGERLVVSPADLAWICAFYVRIGDSLLRTA